MKGSDVIVFNKYNLFIGINLYRFLIVDDNLYEIIIYIKKGVRFF